MLFVGADLQISDNRLLRLFYLQCS